ncbi:MAG: patatin-like phospholipase family protein, partial [Burkholderiaceae bacterium]
MFSCQRAFSYALLFLIAFAGLSMAQAQTSPPSSVPDPAAVAAAAPSAKPRPKIGLVLSGGGARGAAHIGVLKVLEELRIPVDFIAGTSMGSIVGGSYASGMSVVEMEKAVANITTEKLFTDNPPRQDAPMRIKADDFLPLAAPQFGVGRDGLTLPKGVISGVALEGELRQLVKLRGFRKFDELPIPFRAIATNLGNGQMFVFDRGELPMAMRGSMAVPGLVAPLNFDGTLLVDGGLVRNLPVDVARNMGADIIIAVNLGTPLLKPDQIQGLFGVSMQMINILTEQNVGISLGQLSVDDVLILPELGEFSAGDFDNLLKTVPIGEAAARKVAEKLKRYSLPPVEYASLRLRQSVPEAKPTPPLNAILVAGNKRVNQEVIVGSLETEVGKPIDQNVLDLDMRRIYGRGDFESVRPEVREADGKETLVVNVTEKSWGPDYVRFGLQLEADLGHQARFDLLAS